MNERQITNAFSRTRELPPELSAGQVESMIAGAGSLVPKAPGKGVPRHLLNVKFLSGIAFLIVAAFAIVQFSSGPKTTGHTVAQAAAGDTAIAGMPAPVPSAPVSQPQSATVAKENLVQPAGTPHAGTNVFNQAQAASVPARFNQPVTDEAPVKNTIYAADLDRKKKHATADTEVADAEEDQIVPADPVRPKGPEVFIDCSRRMSLNKDVLKIFGEELFKDGLISDTNHFSFSITRRRFYLDGKKQPATVFNKYSKLFEETNGSKIRSFTTFKYSICGAPTE